jgi:hypothetical protein
MMFRPRFLGRWERLIHSSMKSAQMASSITDINDERMFAINPNPDIL